MWMGWQLPWKSCTVLSYKGEVDGIIFSEKLLHYFISRLTELGLIDRCVILESCKAMQKDIVQVHTDDTYQKLNGICQMCDMDKIEENAAGYDAIYFNKVSLYVLSSCYIFSRLSSARSADLLMLDLGCLALSTAVIHLYFLLIFVRSTILFSCPCYVHDRWCSWCCSKVYVC